MEEAYAHLYKEFVRLRTLCLQQASLLQQLTAALKKQQEGGVNGDLKDSTSVPGDICQLDSEYPIYLNSAPPPPPVFTTAASCSTQGPSVNSGNFSDLLAQDISRLSIDATAAQRKELTTELSVPHTLNSQMTLFRGASYIAGKHQPLSHNGEYVACPVPSYPRLCPDAMAQSRGAMISDVTLQSHVCEFCEAVFPGDTTTRGQYLQHLYTHIS